MRPAPSAARSTREVRSPAQRLWVVPNLLQKRLRTMMAGTCPRAERREFFRETATTCVTTTVKTKAK